MSNKMKPATEANYDGLVGPTHNYAGLSYGNVASARSAQRLSNPKQAALQGLTKMKALHDMGVVQGVLAPQERPDLGTLRRLGFTGSDAEILQQAAKESPALLAAASSASSMWTANAATVSPSADTADGRVHFTPANLVNKFHRSIEHEVTGRILQASFPGDKHFVHHQALPSVEHLGDEGAANHTRFCSSYGERGIEFFVYGRAAFAKGVTPQRFPARQTLEASQSIARLHGLEPAAVVYAQQHPHVIDAGVFHNDVIAVGNRDLLLCHEEAYLEQEQVLQALNSARGGTLRVLQVPSAQVSVQDAVTTYLFNSQILSVQERTVLVVPEECRENPAVWSYLEKLRDGDSPIDELLVFDLRESMSNGGGPACLRLRVVLTDEERAASNGSTLMSDSLFAKLSTWIHSHYRDKLSASDLVDPTLLTESRQALDELTQILDLGSIYPFQR